MESLIKDNAFILLFITFYYLFMSKFNKDSQKIIVMYILIDLFGIFNITNLKATILIYTICFFIYYEFLISDEFKLKLVNKIRYKIIDFIYLLLKYHYILFLLSLSLTSNYMHNKIPIDEDILSCVSFIFINIINFRLINNPFELHSFTNIYNNHIKITTYDNFNPIPKDFEKIVTLIEDKTFYKRKNNYTILCWEYLQDKLHRFNEIQERINNGKKHKHTLLNIMKFIYYVIYESIIQIFEILNNIKNVWRGYSTIEMQLFRQIAVKSGYENKYQRKIAEFIYTQIYFKSLKSYLKTEYKSVSDKRYKDYIMYCYITIAPPFINNKNFKSISKLYKKDINKLSNTEFCIFIISLSGRINSKSNYGLIKRKYYPLEKYIKEKEYNTIVRKLCKRASA